MTPITIAAIFFLPLGIFLIWLSKYDRFKDFFDRADKVASILGFLFTITSILILAYSNSPIGETAVLNPAKFIYQVQVQDNQTNTPIEDANVTIAIPNAPPKSNQTDSNGYTNIEFTNNYLGIKAELSVTASGYNSYSQYIELDNGLPHTILLSPQE